MVVLALLLAMGAAVWGQGTTPKPKAGDYPAHASAADIEIGAEYMVHSIAARGDVFLAPDYLVVEVALYGRKGQALDINAGRFTLRINGKKTVVLPQAPGMVAASVKYPDWEERKRVEMTAGVGDADVILGRPRPVERFPGDPRPREQRLPQPPQVPEAENRSGLDPKEKVKPEDAVTGSALPEGSLRAPVSGYLYFAYKGKAGKIKSLELLVDGATLKLL